MSEGQEIIKPSGKSVNDIKPLKNIKQLDTLQLDLDSPRFQTAMATLGLKKSNLKPTDIEVVDDITNLRFEHFQNRLLETINKILMERNRMKMEKYRSMMTKMNYDIDKKRQDVKGRKNQLSAGDPTFITSTQVTSPSPAVTFLPQRTRKHKILGDDDQFRLFPEKKLRDKTEEVRERRTQKLLDEDEYARK